MYIGTVHFFEKGIGVLVYGEMKIPFQSAEKFKKGDKVYFTFKRSEKGRFTGVEVIPIKDSLISYVDPFSDIRTLSKPYFLQKL